MRNLKLAVIIALALVAGCSISAGISRGQDLSSDIMPSVLIEHDNFRAVHNASVRVRAYKNGKISWMGSGLVYKIENNRLSVLSNEHVCGGADSITGEFFHNGRSLGQYKMRVDLCKQSDDGVDIGVISCEVGTKLKEVSFIPFSRRKVKEGDEVFFVGAARGEWPKGKLGRVVEVTDMHFFSNPTSIPGDSGSGMVIFSEDGAPEIVGLIAWYAAVEGERVCMAMHSEVVLSVLAGGEVPDLDTGEVPPPSLETDRLIQGLLERLRELREENKRERDILRDRLSQMQIDDAFRQQESQLFRERWKKQQEESIDQADGLQDRIMGQFNTLKQLVQLAKWGFYALVAALLISIFAGQGWLTRVVVTVLKLLFHAIRGATTIILDAVSKPIKDTNTPKQALDNLREEIGNAIDDDPAT